MRARWVLQSRRRIVQKLRVSANGHYLIQGDGTPFFWLGDTAWKLARLTPEDVDRYLENRAGRGFNVIQVNVSGGQPDYAGHMPFQGAGPPYPSVHLNEAYWRHIDHIVRRAREHSLYVAAIAWWGRAADSTFTQPEIHNYQYGRALGARYAEQPHMVWVGAAEYHTPNMWRPPLSEEHLANVIRVVEGIRDADSGDHLVTMHPLSFLSSSEEFHDQEWLDFNMVQTHVYPHYIEPLVSGDWVRTPTKPTLNAEPWYEGEEKLYERRARIRRIDDEPYDTAWIQRYQAYWSVFCGGFGYTYGHMNLWCMHPTAAYWETDRAEMARVPGVLLQSALDAPGSADLCHLRTLIESWPLLARVPAPELISTNTRGTGATLSPNLRCATRDEDGAWAFVYSTRGEVVRVHMCQLAAGQARCFWYNPRNGTWHGDGADHKARQPLASGVPAGIPSGPGAPDRYFHPPGEPADGNDWVLVLEIE
jgi:hypothetical protein